VILLELPFADRAAGDEIDSGAIASVHPSRVGIPAREREIAKSLRIEQGRARLIASIPD
jgi:hypothetical protein